MVLFAALAVPLLLYLYFGLGVLSTPLEVSVFRRPMIKGAATFPLILAVLLLLDLLLLRRYTFGPLFAHYLLRETLVLPYLIVGGAFLACRSLLLRGDWELFTGMLVYSGINYALLGVADLVLEGYYYSNYALFLRPALRMAELTILTAAAISIIRQNGGSRVIAILLFLAVPPMSALVGAFEMSARLWPAILITLLLLALGAGVIYIGPALGYVRPKPE